MITTFERFEKVQGPQGVGSERFMGYQEAITRQVNLDTTLTGTGSPEGVVSANPTQKYMDTTGAIGFVSYIKQTGAGNTGWVLIG